MKTRFYLTAILTSLVLFSCNKDDSEYVKKSDLMKINGTCKVLLTGTSRDGYSLNESFDLNARGYPGQKGYNEYYEKYDNVSFFIAQSSYENVSYIKFEIIYNKTNKTTNLKYVALYYKNFLDPKNVILFSEDFFPNFSDSDIELNNFNFDNENSKVSGEILLSKKYTTSGTERTLIGTVEFNVNVTKVVNKNGPDSRLR